MATYKVRYDRDESGWWVASVPKVKGCRTQGKSIEQARTRIREALALFVDNADKATLVDDVRVATAIRRKLAAVEKLKRQADAARSKMAAETRALARRLAREESLSVRDVGELLHVSGARVQQLLEDE